jgi:hypothetical protein
MGRRGQSLTLLVVADEHYFSQIRREVVYQGKIISDLNLTGFVNDDRLYRHKPHDTSFPDEVVGHRAQGTQDDPSVSEFSLHTNNVIFDLVSAYDPLLNLRVQVLVPVGGSLVNIVRTETGN